jgi:ferritin
VLISKTMNNKLNKQIAVEFMAAHKYLAMSCVLDSMGLKVLRRRFFEQYEEECEHALKILDYVLEVGGDVDLGAIDKPNDKYKSVEEIVETALESEMEVTRLINEIAALAQKENDFATRSFINWFVDEQVEEVSSMTDLLQIVRLAKGNMLQVETRVRHEMMKEKS